VIYLQGGPIGLTMFIILVLSIGFGICYAWFWWLARPREQHANEVKRLNALVVETRRVLAADARHVNDFVHGFGREISVEFAGAEWLQQFTLDDMRKHVEVAVFDLIKGCRCGHCVGMSNGGAFWIEATYSMDGITLTGYVAHSLMSVAITCPPPEPGTAQHQEPLRTSVPPYQNVEMKCACGKPVMTSLDHIGEGKKPVCASCIAGGSRAQG